MNLNPCPFCGSMARYVDNAPDGGYFIECTKCLCATRIIYPSKCDPKRELEESWNSRIALEGKILELVSHWQSISEDLRADADLYPIPHVLHTSKLAQAKELESCIYALKVAIYPDKLAKEPREDGL